MKIFFSISFNKKTYRFNTVSDMEEFITRHKQATKNAVLTLFDEGKRPIGKMKVTEYLKRIKENVS
jgi:hypothetical protein